MQNTINWFEIPVTDMDRAVKFYSTVLGATLTVETMHTGQMAMLPHDELEYTGITKTLAALDERFEIREKD